MGRFLNLRNLILVGAVAAGFFTIFLMSRYLNLRESQLAAALREQLAREGITQLVVASRDIVPARTITAEDVKKVPWPRKAVPKGSFPEVSGLQDRVAARKIIEGMPVLEGHLAPKGAGTGLAAIIPQGKRAVSVRVNEIIGVAGFIQPGDLVDVIVTLEPDKKTGIITKTVLQQVPVLAVGQEITREGGTAKRVSAVTLLVDPVNAEKLALASRSDIQLAMRAAMDKRSVATKGATPIRLIGLTRPAPKPAPKPLPPPAIKPMPPLPPPPPPPITVEVIRGSIRGVEQF
jgi:pilus assembly protein CpaB